MDVQHRLAQYAPIRLKPDLSRLSVSEQKMLPLLLQAADAMEIPFWTQEYGDREPLVDSISDADVLRYIKMNYGPWDRMHGNEPITPETGPKPPGANYYPRDISTAELDTVAVSDPAIKSPFTMIRRDGEGKLVAIPYHRFFREHVQLASDRLRHAAELAELQEQTRFLKLRAEALSTDDYRASDYAWMDLRNNTLELLIGPMEIEDRLFGIKTAYAASILVKDKEMGARLSRYTEALPRFQESLPVSVAYKQQRPGLESDLQIYDAIHFAGLDACYTPTGIAWPSDEEVQLTKGLRSLLLKNVMRAKYDAILKPMAALLIASDQLLHLNFEAHFNRIMFHELAHGLGIKFTINDNRPVREALGEFHHPMEEAKADLVGQLIAIKLWRQGVIAEPDLWGLFVASLMGLLYNGDGTHAIMLINYFKEMGAYSRDRQSGTYRVHPQRMMGAIETLAEKILRFQGDGDYEGTRTFIQQYGGQDEELMHDMDRWYLAGLPLGLTLQH